MSEKNKYLKAYLSQSLTDDNDTMWFYDRWVWNTTEAPYISMLDRSGAVGYNWNFIEKNGEGKWVGEYHNDTFLIISKGSKKNTILVNLLIHYCEEVDEIYCFSQTIKLFKNGVKAGTHLDFEEGLRELLDGKEKIDCCSKGLSVELKPFWEEMEKIQERFQEKLADILKDIKEV